MDLIRFIGLVKSQYKQDLHCSSYKEKTATILRRRVLQDFIFPVPANTYLISRLVLILARVKQYPKANRPEYNERSPNLQP